MKFIVERKKSGMFEDEYDVRLEDKTKKRLQIAVVGLAILGPAAYFVKNGPSSVQDQNDPGTPEST